jgi:hypothetical protein
MRASPFPPFLGGPFLACFLALALGWPSSAAAWAPSKAPSSKPKGDKGDKGKGTEKDPGDSSVPAAPVDSPPRIGRIYVDADGLGSAGPVVGGRAMRAGRGSLEAQGVQITDAPAGPELRVVLTERSSGGYRVSYEIIYDGKTVKDGTGGFDCQLCTEDELVEKVEALAIQVAPKLVVPAPEKDPGPGPGPDPDPDPDPDLGPDPDGRDPGPAVQDDPGRLGGKGKAGVALLVMGGVGAITGVSLVAIKPSPVEGDPREATKVESTRPVGGAVLGVGAAMVIVGAVLLGIDRKQAKRKASKTKAAAMVHPWFGPGAGGLGIHGRF